MAMITKKLICVIYYFIFHYAIRACHGACNDEISVCSRMFSVKKQALGSAEDGICSLAKTFAACVTALKPGCNTQGKTNIDNGLQGIKSTYEGIKYNCTIDIDATDIAKACMTHFDTCCSVQTPSNPCRYLTLYETCLQNTNVYCSSNSVINATKFITQRAANLTQTYGCDFDSMTTTPAPITGNACFELFNNCKASKLTRVPSNICLAVPVYQDCLENTIKNRCDTQSYYVVHRYVTSVISDNNCDITTTLSTTLSKSTLSTTGIASVVRDTPTSATSVTSPSVETRSGINLASVSMKTFTTTKNKEIYVVSVSQSSKNSGDLFIDFGDSASRMTSLDLVVITAITTLVIFNN